MLQYPWEPHKSILQNYDSYAKLTWYGVDNLDNIDQLIREYCIYYIDTSLQPQINDLIHLTVKNGLNHTQNRDTLALARDRIHSSIADDHTLRFLIAFLYEKQVGFSHLVTTARNKIALDIRSQKYKMTNYLELNKIVLEWGENANKIVEIMRTSRSKVGNLTEDSDFIRNWALIDLGKKTGLEVTANGNPFNIGLVRNNLRGYHQLLVSQSTMMERLQGLQVIPNPNRVVTPDDVTITAKNGPSEVRIKTDASTWATPFVLAKDESRIITKAEMAHDIESTPILIPTVLRQLPAITDLNVAVTESVNLTDLFDGIRTNITAVSSDTNKVTVAVNSRQSSMGVTGVAVGTTKVTVTGTNEAGAVSVDFDITVTAAD